MLSKLLYNASLVWPGLLLELYSDIATGLQPFICFSSSFTYLYFVCKAVNEFKGSDFLC